MHFRVGSRNPVTTMTKLYVAAARKLSATKNSILDVAWGLNIIL